MTVYSAEDVLQIILQEDDRLTADNASAAVGLLTDDDFMKHFGIYASMADEEEGSFRQAACELTSIGLFHGIREFKAILMVYALSMGLSHIVYEQGKPAQGQQDLNSKLCHAFFEKNADGSSTRLTIHNLGEEHREVLLRAFEALKANKPHMFMSQEDPGHTHRPGTRLDI